MKHLDQKLKGIAAKKKDEIYSIKGIFHSKMKIAPWFTHPNANLCVYDFLLSDEYNWNYI